MRTATIYGYLSGDRRFRYPISVRQKAIARVLVRGGTCAETARDLNVPYHRVRIWVRRFKAALEADRRS